MPGSLVLAFGVVLVIGVLISERVSRTVLSTSVLFLGAFVLEGRGHEHGDAGDPAPQLASSLREVGVHVGELVKLATLLLFGALLSLPFLFATGVLGVAFALVALLAARPLALVLALLGGGLTRSEWLADAA